MTEAGKHLRGLEAAALEYLNIGYEWPLVEKLLRDTPAEHRQAAMQARMPKRRAAEGYFLWIEHLAWLDRVLQVVPGLKLYATEVEGLLVWRGAKTKFEASHPGCPKCGMPNEAGSLRCRECMAELRG